MDRIKILCSYLNKCKSFADVACDHGYCAQYMLKNKLCESAVISDISEKSLSKAQTLLSAYIKSGVCSYVVCDGLASIGEDTEQVLIAGIGGEEICKILKNAFIPQTFVFQPMKNAQILRSYLIENCCEITVDDIFTDGKNYYFIICGNRNGGRAQYTKAQLEFGRDSLKNKVFGDYLEAELAKKRSYLTRQMAQENRTALENKIKFYEEVLNGVIE